MAQYKTLSGESYDIKKDPQKNKVYKWEDAIVRPLDINKVSIEVAQQIVNHIWLGEGREFPPQVEIKTRKNARCSDATRFQLRFLPQHLYTWIIIHELAHTFTSNEDGASNGHGSWFVQTYIYLLSKYAKIDMLMLMTTADQHGIKIKGIKNG